MVALHDGRVPSSTLTTGTLESFRHLGVASGSRGSLCVDLKICQVGLYEIMENWKIKLDYLPFNSKMVILWLKSFETSAFYFHKNFCQVLQKSKMASRMRNSSS